jgi:transposase-like protein
MEQAESIQKSSTKKKCPKRSNRYGAGFKLQIVKKYLEESVPVSVIRQECGVANNTVRRWVNAYRR